MERLIQLAAVVVLGIACWMYFFGGSSAPEIQALRETGLSRSDAKLIASYVRVYADMVIEDGERAEPYIPTVGELKLKMRDLGNLTIGTKWKIGEKYPTLPPILASYFKLEEMDRMLFHDQADQLAIMLEKV